MKHYYYRREDDGKLEKVEFERAISQDAMGFIVLGDGVQARRVHSMDPKPKRRKKTQKVRAIKDRPIISDTLGIGVTQLNEMEADRKINGLGVEFVPDPMVEGFFQAKFGSEKEKMKYAKHRGLGQDRNGINGKFMKLSEEDFEKACELVSR